MSQSRCNIFRDFPIAIRQRLHAMLPLDDGVTRAGEITVVALPENSKPGGVMSIKIPASVNNYLAADKDSDLDKLSQCFTKDARVHDDHHEYEGLEAIRSWKVQTNAKYRYVVEPLR